MRTKEDVLRGGPPHLIEYKLQSQLYFRQFLNSIYITTRSFPEVGPLYWSTMDWLFPELGPIYILWVDDFQRWATFYIVSWQFSKVGSLYVYYELMISRGGPPTYVPWIDDFQRWPPPPTHTLYMYYDSLISRGGRPLLWVNDSPRWTISKGWPPIFVLRGSTSEDNFFGFHGIFVFLCSLFLHVPAHITFDLKKPFCLNLVLHKVLLFCEGQKSFTHLWLIIGRH